jgi:hypothetical protein
MKTRKDVIVRFIFAIGFIAMLQCLSITASAQWLPDNNTTLSSGSYTDLGWNGTLTVTGPITANSMTTGNGTLLVENGGVVTVSGDVQRGSIIVKTGGKLIVNGILTLKSSEVQSNASITAATLNISNSPNTFKGTVTVTGTTTIHNGPLNFNGCGFLKTVNLTNSAAPNPVTGDGLIVVSGVFSGSNSLTASTSIMFNKLGTGSGNKGAATLTNSTSTACTLLPIKFTSFSVRRIN